MDLFENRRQTKPQRGFSSTSGREEKKTRKTGVYFTSEMQGILAIKESNEKKAAVLVSEYLTSIAEETYDKKAIMSNLDKMLMGFTTEEKFRIVSQALVEALCKIS